MADIFNRTIQNGGAVLSTDNAIATVSAIGADNGIGVLMQGVRIEYTQEFQDIYELGSTTRYYVAMRPTGKLHVERIISLQGMSAGDAFNTGQPTTVQITMTASQVGGQGVKVSYTMNGVVPTSYVVDYKIVGSCVINESLDFRFMSLSKG